MGWVNKLQGKVVGLDTAPLIYFIEEHPTYLPIIQPFFEAMDRNELTIITSTVTLLEVLVYPFRADLSELVDEYREILLGTANLLTMDITPEIAEKASRLRAAHNIRTPDAIQLATAICEDASFFLTNDTRFPKTPSLELLILNEL